MGAAEDVLDEYQDRFLSDMDASAVAQDLFNRSIIPDGVPESVEKADGPRQKNSILYDCLLRTCSNRDLIMACGIITSIQGNPKMSALGGDIQRRLESGMCMHVCNLVHFTHTT